MISMDTSPVNPALAPYVVAETMNFVMSAFGKRIL